MKIIYKKTLLQHCAIALLVVSASLSSAAEATVGLKLATVTWDAKQPTHPGVQLNPILGNNLIGLIVNQTWRQMQTVDICDGLKARMTKANGVASGVNAYPGNNWNCSIGDVSNLHAKLAGKNIVELTFTAQGNHLQDKFTQPSVAGNYADPELSFDWDMNFVIDLKVSGSQPYLSFTKATVQVSNVKTDSHNFAGDIAVSLLGIRNEVNNSATAKAIDFTKQANEQLAKQATLPLPPANYAQAGVWVQNDYVYIGYTPLVKSGYQLHDTTVQGRLHWPVSSDVKVLSCADLTVSAETIIGPPELLNPEPAKFNQIYPRFATTSNDADAHWNLPMPVLSGNEMECSYTMRAASGAVVSVNSISNKAYPDPKHNYTIMQLNFAGDGNYAAVSTPGNGVNFAGAWSTSNINPFTSHGVIKQKILIDHGIGQMGGMQGAVVRSPAAIATPAVSNSGTLKRMAAPVAAPQIMQQHIGGAIAAPAPIAAH